MKPIDFTRYPMSNKYYGGSEKKIGILISDSEYMVKFQKKTPFGVRNNHISEYLGSHVFLLLSLPAQETYLGYYNEEQVVACKDFNKAGEQFVPFNDVGESTLDQDKERYQYDYEDIMQMLRDNSKITNVNETISMFWNIYIVDALLGNFDRHGANWGFIKKENLYSLAPVFDNGSCLYPNLTDENEMIKIMASEEETNKRVYTFPTSQIRLNRTKSSYYEVIHSLAFSECNTALLYIQDKMNLKDLYTMIDDAPLLSDIQREFYKHMITARYQKIILESAILLRGN